MISARKRGAALRCFFALSLPEEVQRACAALVALLRRRADGDAVRWVRPEAAHLTLRFLGNVAAELLPGLIEAAQDALAQGTPFELRLLAPVGFPARSRPRVVVLPAVPEGPIEALAEQLERVVVAAGLPAERRVFRPHVTLGRLRSHRLPSLEGLAGPQPGTTRVREAVLFRSDLEREGARYSALARIPIGSGAPGLSLASAGKNA